MNNFYENKLSKFEYKMETKIYNTFKSRLIFGKYSIKFLISKSTFSEVYFGTNVLNGKNYALKIGTNEKDNYVLKNESYILINLKGPGIPSVISYGISGKYNILVENLLGKSIKNIWLEKNKKFNLKDTCIFAIQAISLLEYVHSKNYLHRDIKPANFLVGNPDNSQIYLIDFGNASKFRSSRTGKHIKKIKSSSVYGSLIFLSLNAFKGIIQTRKDDLESLGLVIIYLYKGLLPWSEIRSTNIYQSWDKVETIRNIVSNDYICRGMPQEMNIYMNYINNLKYDECPNYEYLRQLFLNILKNIGDANEQLFSWVDKRRKQSSKKSTSKSKKRKVKIIIHDLLKKNAIKENLYRNLKKEQSNINEEQVIHNRNYTGTYNINISLTTNNTIKKNINKDKKVLINNKDKNIKKVNYKNEKIRNNQYSDIKKLALKNNLIIDPKKINYKKIYKIENNREKTQKNKKDIDYSNIFEKLFNKNIINNKFKFYNNHFITQGNSFNNREIRNCINIENISIYNNSEINEYPESKNNSKFKKLDRTKKNKINHIKTYPYNSFTQKSYRPELFSSHINSQNKKSNLFENKLKDGNSNQLNFSIKEFMTQQNSLLIQNSIIDDKIDIHNFKLYKLKGLANNRLIKFIINNPNNNIN